MKKIIELDNYQALFGLRILKSILSTFVESFLVLYFLTLSNHNIIPLGIYNLVSMTTVFITIFLLRNICKTKQRINLLRIGIILDIIYFLVIILLNDKVIDYIYFIGILYGLEEGFYYSVYNMFESNGVTNQKRTSFNGNFTAIRSILSIIIPLIFGGLISKTSFLKSIILVIIIVVIQIVLSYIFKDSNIPSNNKTNIKEYISIYKKDKSISQVYKINLFYGLTYSKGAFQSIIMVYIIKIFSNSFSLGVFTSIFSLISFLLGILFANKIKKKDYSNIIHLSMFLTILSLSIMILNCNMLTIIIFNFFQTISKVLIEMINTTSQANLSNLKLIKKDYKVEYYLGIEFSLFIGRFISQSLFIVMAFTNEIFIIPIFIVFLIMLTINSIKLQEYTNK